MLFLPKDVAKIIINEIAVKLGLRSFKEWISMSDHDLKALMYSFLSFRHVSKQWDKLIMDYFLKKVYVPSFSPLIKKYTSRVERVIYIKQQPADTEIRLNSTDFPSGIKYLWINTSAKYINASLPPLKRITVTKDCQFTGNMRAEVVKVGLKGVTLNRHK